MRSSLALMTSAAILVAGSFACSHSETTPVTPTSNTAANPTTGGGPGGTSSAKGTLTIHLTDSPFSDAKALLVTFSEVSVHQADPGDWKTLSDSGFSRTCDLKQLTNSATDVLGVGTLDAGKYTQIRLNVASAAIYFDNAATSGPCAPQIAAPAGQFAAVEIPSGEVKLNNEFTVPSGGATKIVLDFDGDQSVHQTGSSNSNGRGNAPANSKYMMTPVIRLVSVQ